MVEKEVDAVDWFEVEYQTQVEAFKSLAEQDVEVDNPGDSDMVTNPSSHHPPDQKYDSRTNISLVIETQMELTKRGERMDEVLEAN